MSNLQKGLLSLAIALSVIACLVAFKSKQVQIPFLPGSVAVANEYHATSTRNYIGLTAPTLSVLCSAPGALGSVVITGAAAGQINLYDATSSRTNTEWATTTLATIPLSAAANTYTFDVTFLKGLMYEFIGTAPTSTITYRCNA